MDQASAVAPLANFLDSGVDHPTLGFVYGRRRIGKSTLLDRISADRGGFYWEATRAERPIQLTRLGETLGSFLNVGRLSFDRWDEAVDALLRLGRDTATPVVIDEFGYVLEADRSVDSAIAAALGPHARRATRGRARLILCGSAIGVMRSLSAGQAPLRGRAGIELAMQPFDFRSAAMLFRLDGDLALAARVHAVIGGVIGYATDMVDNDLPARAGDFARWVCDRVLAPSATLHHEGTALLAEDPTLSDASAVTYHSILGSIANGAVTAGTIANRLRRSVPNIDPMLKRLIAAGFVLRHEDPIRSQRPLYSLADPFLQFHYAVLEPHGQLLRERDPGSAWKGGLAATFDSRVRGPVFEEMARTWVRRFAASSTIGAESHASVHVGPSSATIDGEEHQLDVIVANDDAGARPADRSVAALGEAKAGERIGMGHLAALERTRAALGPRASQAKLLLFAPTIEAQLRTHAARRPDVELVDLERLYHGS